MLEHLDISNYALIENLSIDFSEGFNVITGETGSGKSIILGALGLLLGEKADSSSIRTGCEMMTVNAVVSVPEGSELEEKLRELDIEAEDGQIIIRRSVKNNGKSSIRVQDRVVSRSELASLSETFIDMHGQSEHQSLLSSERQRRILDSYSDNSELLRSCQSLSNEICALLEKKKDLEIRLEEGRRMADYLQMATEEISSVDPKISEDDELKEKIALLGQFETIFESVSLCTEKLRNVRRDTYDASTLMDKAAKADPVLGDVRSRVESLGIEAEDIMFTLKERLDSIDYSEDALNRLQDRLAQIQRLKRKYGQTIEKVLEFNEQALEKLDITKNSDHHIKECEKALSLAQASYNKISQELSLRRKKNALVLQSRIGETLRTLGMPNAVFVIRVDHDDLKVSSNGGDSVSFLISANPGEPEKLMKEIASGGELSRVMLALKTVLAKSDDIQVQVFDEVDSGIGGSVAKSLANCICDLSKDKQVIAITHLASIASRAESQFVVSKEVRDNRTYSHLVQCTGEDRVHEIARMLSGDEDDVALEHARELLR